METEPGKPVVLEFWRLGRQKEAPNCALPCPSRRLFGRRLCAPSGCRSGAASAASGAIRFHCFGAQDRQRVDSGLRVDEAEPPQRLQPAADQAGPGVGPGCPRSCPPAVVTEVSESARSSCCPHLLKARRQGRGGGPHGPSRHRLKEARSCNAVLEDPRPKSAKDQKSSI